MDKSLHEYPVRGPGLGLLTDSLVSPFVVADFEIYMVGKIPVKITSLSNPRNDSNHLHFAGTILLSWGADKVEIVKIRGTYNLNEKTGNLLLTESHIKYFQLVNAPAVPE